MEDKRQLVFVLGDSRTGTSSVHNFLIRAGYNAIHYYNAECGIIFPEHLNYEENWILLKKFIDNSGFNAFSDYPTRLFYKDLLINYPQAKFVVTRRATLDIWKNSMINYFEKFAIHFDIDEVAHNYLTINEKISINASELGVPLLDICIDEDNNYNEKMLKSFLNIDKNLSLGFENASSDLKNKLWSERIILYNAENDIINHVKVSNSKIKSMLTEFGWLFLINDTSDFLEYYFGEKTWNKEQLSKAVGTLNKRFNDLSQKGVLYLKFVIPEKTTIYPEYLPKIMSELEVSKSRPAMMLDEVGLDFVHYLQETLVDAKSYGLLYFRGDSHSNWLGAYFIYNYIVTEMNNKLRNFEHFAPIPLKDLAASLAGYGGDLYDQINDEHKRHFSQNGAWAQLGLGLCIEHTIKYEIVAGLKNSKKIDCEELYRTVVNDRDIFVFTNQNKNLPRAVIFRDSTCDFMIDFLAEHFSYCIFIWHKGYCYEDIIEREKPDVVLHLMAERFVIQYEYNNSFDKYF